MASSGEDHEVDEIAESDEDYYTFLNVGREATIEEISNAYRRLSRLYHPDKHSDPVRKRYAEQLFNKTKKAYEVLSDPHSRAIYDSLGTKGLETEGWEVVQRTKTPQEIREEYERLARERDERKLQQRTNPKGSIIVNINASDIFESYDDDDIRVVPELEVSGMTISQSIEAPLTLGDTMTLSGHLQTQNGNGSGTVNCSWRRVLSAKSWSELELGAGNGPLVSLRFFRTLSKRSFANAAVMCHVTPQGLRPGFQAAIGRQLDRHTTGCLTWKAGMQSSMNTMVVWDTSSSHLACGLQFGIPNTFAMISYTHKFREDGKARGSIKIGTFGVLIDYGCERKISQHSVLGATMTLGVPTGVTLKIKINRGSQSYIFPIFLSENLLPGPIFYGTFVPIITYYVIKVLVVSPYLKRQKKREAEKQKEANASKIAEKRQEAESAVALMQETFQRIWQQEDSKRGLLILKAFYGKITPESGSQISNEVINVTIPLQCLVKDSRLAIHESSKSQLPGFYDPCVGEDKFLYVQYKFHSLLHETTVKDNESLRIPKQAHRVDS